MQKTKKKNKQNQLGKSLMNDIQKHKFKPILIDTPTFIHTENNEKPQMKNLSSVIDQDNLQEFLEIAQLQNKNYEAERGIRVTKSNNVDQEKEIIIDTFYQQQQATTKETFNVDNNQILSKLRIPRKPKWTREMAASELQSLENQSFLQWRRGLAQIEEEYYTIQLTPYEKNLEVWRQLWRVIERSDILVQIVDGRDPLFYRCEDLEQMVQEISEHKINFLLVNKSDLLTTEVRERWNEFFNRKNINHMFFSAKMEQQIINQNLEKQIIYDEEKEQEEEKLAEKINTPQIANRNNLLCSLKKLVKHIQAQKIEEYKKEIKENHTEQQQFFEKIVTIGMVGYPNVGKSSVINTLCNKKLVGVAPQPGKTKNFQTIYLQDDLVLCDCPGLVFPNAASTRAEMVCNGVLPIDKQKDYLSPVDLLVERIPKLVFEKLYTLNLSKYNKITATILLSDIAASRGHFMQGSGLPDQAFVAKQMLKDLVSGKLLYCKLPPDYHKIEEIWQFNHEASEKYKPLVLQEQLKEEEQKQIQEQEASSTQTQEQKQQKEQENEEIDKHLTEEVKNIFDNFVDEEMIRDIKVQFDEEDLINLMEGKRIKGIKLTKAQRREIKFAINRGEQIDYKKYLLPNQIINYSDMDIRVKSNRSNN